MRVLGIHDGHNASLCLIEDGEVRFAMQEERLVYEKNKSGFPKVALQHLLKAFHLQPQDIDTVAMASEHTSPEFASGEYFEKHRKSTLRRYAEHAIKKTPLYFLYKTRRRKERVGELLAFGFTERQITFVEHHLCHAATAYYGSHFPKDQKVLILTNDGAGDGLCATVSLGYENKIERLAAVESSDSLAAIYCLVTKMLGFTPLEHEYKLMGMAPYCSEKATQNGYGVFKDLIVCSQENPLLFHRTTPQPVGMLMPELQKRTQFMRMDVVCAGLQKFTEEVLVQWVESCVRHTGISRVALAGGIFMNVKANKRIMELPVVEDLFVYPSCGDETVSLGAAYWAYAQRTQIPNSKFQAPNTKIIPCTTSYPPLEPLTHFYFGDDFTDEEAERELCKCTSSGEKFSWKKIKHIEKKIAQLLAQGEVVARCKGPMEFGARALGNRSLLADPHNLRCIRELNLMVKKRDFWMPFAPVILEERQHEYLVNPKKIPAPYMILSFDTTAKHADFIAAVHQADLTARPQVISQKMNPEYYRVLKEFEKVTGRGVLLNTSFNLHGFPIVHGPKEALDVFLNSGLRFLALGNYLVEK